MFTRSVKCMLFVSTAFLPVANWCVPLPKIQENTYQAPTTATKFQTNISQASQWFDEQPLIVQIPVGIGALVLAAATASGVLYTAAYTAGFIPSFIFHPFNTVEQICTGNPQKILGAVGTAAVAAVIAYIYPQYQQKISLKK